MKKTVLLLMFLCSIICINNIKAQLNGNYTIGTGFDFTNFTEASTALTVGIDGDVTFFVKDSVYNESISISFLNPDNYKVIFKPMLTNVGSITISFAPTSNNWVINFGGAFNVHFEGINFSNPTTGGPYLSVVNFSNTNNNITFNNCSFNSYGYSSTVDNSIVYHNSITDTDKTDNLMFRNCYFSGGYNGIFLKAFSQENGLVIDNCYFNNQKSMGVYANKQSDVLIKKCEINCYDTDTVGLFLDSCADNFKILSNNIRLSSDYGNYGLIIKNSGTVNFTKNQIFNNMISASGSILNSYGITIQNSNDIDIYHNSISILAGGDGANPFNKELHIIGNGSALDIIDVNTSNITIKNNIFSIESGAYNYSFETPASILECNYNLLYNNLGDLFSIINGTNQYNSLSEWNAVTSFDTNSIYGYPNFIYTDNLHLYSPNLAESSGCILYTNIDNDFDNEKRFGSVNYFGKGSAPDIGADEGDFEKIYTGTISQNTFISGNVVFSGEIIIPEYVTVTFAPGTYITLKDLANITVLGSIFAEGNKSQPIIFEPWDGAEWNGFIFPESYDFMSSSFKYCKFNYASNTIETRGGAFTINVLPDEYIEFNNCEFYGNSAVNGGAISCTSGFVKLNANLFNNNSASNNGGAILIAQNAGVKLTNNIFENNYSSVGGAIVLYQNSYDTYIVNNTFYNNSASSASSIYNSTELFTTYLYNNIITGVSQTPEINNVYSTMEAYNNNIIGLATITNLTVNQDNFDLDPGFNNSTYSDFSLLESSVCIDTGYFDTSSLGILSDTDFFGKSRLVNGIFDLGAIEFTTLTAYAGEDQYSCSDSAYLAAQSVQFPSIGYWSVVSGYGTFQDLTSAYSQVTNIQRGANVFAWTVVNTPEFVSDEVMVYNNSSFVYAGPDQIIISYDYPNLITSTTLEGNNQGIIASGSWSLVSGGGTFSNDFNYITDVNGLEHGENIFRWTVYDFNTGCTNNDEVSIFSGYNMVPALGATSITWENPLSWFPPSVPGIGDSVTIYGVPTYIDGINATVASLFIGSGASLYIGGTNGAGSLTVENLRLEDNPVKFPKSKGAASCYLTEGNITINEQEFENEPGIYLGSGATFEIGSSIVKGNSSVSVSSGRSIVMEQTAEKNSSKSSASLTVKNGGLLVFEANNSLAKSQTAAINIRNGGSLVLEQTAEKANTGISLGTGRSIVMEQTAEKGAAPSITLRGGSLVLEQTAEKSSRAASGGIVMRGGSLVLEQTAEKTSIASILVTPSLDVVGGKIIIGDKSPVKAATSSIYARSIVMEQTAEKSLALDTSLIIYGNGGFFYNIIDAVEIPEFRLTNGATVTIFEGGTFDLNDGTTIHNVVMDEKSSFIDYNSINQVVGVVEHNFIADKQQYFCAPFEAVPVSQFAPEVIIKGWDEANSSWFNVVNDILPLQGTKVSYPFDYTQVLNGTFNSGNQTIQVYKSAFDPILQGLNCVGNPYPSAIDWELVTLNSNINTTAYFLDPVNNIISMYQQGGVSINGADQYILPSQAFLIKTDATTDFNVDNSSRVHYFKDFVKQKTTIENLIKLKVENLLFSDETVVRFASDATANVENQYDAVKIFTNILPTPQLFSKTDAGIDLAINTLKLQNGATTVPLVFRTSVPGQYTISVSDLNFPTNVTVMLKDLENVVSTNLKTDPTYTFNILNTTQDFHFELEFTGFVGIEEEISSNDIFVYSYGSDIYFNIINSDDVQYQVYDINGKLLMTDKINRQGVSIISTNLPSGIYIVRTISDKMINNQKVFIQN